MYVCVHVSMCVCVCVCVCSSVLQHKVKVTVIGVFLLIFFLGVFLDGPHHDVCLFVCLFVFKSTALNKNFCGEKKREQL